MSVDVLLLITQVMSVMTVLARQMELLLKMNAEYVVVIALAVQTVLVFQMAQAGKVIVAAYQIIMMVMIVMTVQELQMVMQN